MSALPVVLTRPAGRGDDLSDALKARGMRVELLPLLRIQALPIPDLSQTKAPDHLIFVSPSAVEEGVMGLPDSWRAAKLYAVGKGTARKLADLGWPEALIPHQETSEGLLTLSSLNEVDDDDVVIVRGQGGRELLARSLRQRGAQVRYLEVYVRLGPSVETVQQLQKRVQAPAVIVITSGEALNALYAIIPATARAKVKLVVLGTRLQEMACEKFPHVVVAKNADTESMSFAIERAIKQNG